MKQIIAVSAIKGGTGKSSTTSALAQAAAADGERVLAIDLDPIASTTFFLGADQNAPGSYQLLHGTPARDLIQHTEQGLDVISANQDLATETTGAGSATRLQRALEPIKKDYDWIFIDTPAVIGELTFNALQAATGLVIPLITDSNNVQCLYQIADLAHQLQGSSNPNLHIYGTVITFYSNSNINSFWRDAIIDRGREIGVPYLGTVRKGDKLKEAQSFQKSIFEYSPRCNPAQDYKEIYKSIWEG